MARRTDQNLITAPLSTYHPHRVLYAEVDQMGVVYYGNYFAWFEAGRGEMLRRFGTTYRIVEEEWGVFLPVTHCEADYREGARYDDLLIIETRIVEVTPVRFSFDYKVFRASDGQGSESDFLAGGIKKSEPLVTGKTQHICIDSEGRIKRAGAKVAELIEQNR